MIWHADCMCPYLEPRTGGTAMEGKAKRLAEIEVEMKKWLKKPRATMALLRLRYEKDALLASK